MTTTDAGLMPLVLQLGRARAAAMDVQAVLTSVCSAVPSVLEVGGAVLLLVEPPDGIRALTASDARALWFGEAQRRGGLGPLPGAVRTWRPMLTADLARLGPPAIATAAVQCGLVSSLVLPFDVDGDRLGVLQLLGEVQRPVEAAHAEVLRPLLDVLAARLADVRALPRVPREPDGSSAAATPGASSRPTANGEPVRRSTGRRGCGAADSTQETTSALPAVPGLRKDAAASEAPLRAPQPRAPVDGRRRGRHSA